MWKVALVAGLGVALLAQPALAETIDWGPSNTSPSYTLPVHVIDAMVGTLNSEHRRIWRAARDQALENWGLPFTIERHDELAYAWTDENINAGLAITDIEPNAILLVRNYSLYKQNIGGWVASEGGGIAAYSPWAPWWKAYYFDQLVGAIGHEIGHALGFAHGGNGIMGGGMTRPSALELDLIRGYYL